MNNSYGRSNEEMNSRIQLELAFIKKLGEPKELNLFDTIRYLFEVQKETQKILQDDCFAPLVTNEMLLTAYKQRNLDDKLFNLTCTERPRIPHPNTTDFSSDFCVVWCGINSSYCYLEKSAFPPLSEFSNSSGTLEALDYKPQFESDANRATIIRSSNDNYYWVPPPNSSKILQEHRSLYHKFKTKTDVLNKKSNSIKERWLRELVLLDGSSI